ncbi:MAG TPA: hypothetical protein VGL00_07075 [Terracidiphilus sp.]
MVSTGSLTLGQVLKTAFPEAEGGNQSIPASFPVHVIAQGGEPRWVVVGDSGDAAAVFRSWRPFKIGTRLRWSVVVGAASLRVLSRLPGVINCSACFDLTYWRQALPGFRDDWVPVIYIGNPSHTRKITVFFVARADRRTRAVAKVPLCAQSGGAILNEAAILSQLRGADFLPASLYQDPERGIAAQSWLEGAPVNRTLTPAHMELLARLAVPSATIRVSDQRASIAAMLNDADLPFDREVLSHACELLDYDEPLPAFIEHRDFAPWNLKRLLNGDTGAIDWEWTILRGLPCQDIFRYFYIQDALFRTGGDTWLALNRHPLVRQHLTRYSVPPAALPALAMHYQLRVLAMDWQSGNTFLADYAFRQIQSLLGLKRARIRSEPHSR